MRQALKRLICKILGHKASGPLQVVVRTGMIGPGFGLGLGKIYVEAERIDSGHSENRWIADERARLVVRAKLCARCGGWAV